MLATLLITRQVVGNVKESLIPYAKKQYNMAKLSFDLYGAVSPTSEAAEEKTGDLGMETEDGNTKEVGTSSNGCPTGRTNSVDRTVSQTEVESSHEPVRRYFFMKK